MLPSGPNRLPSSPAQALNARFASYSSHQSFGGGGEGSSSTAPGYTTSSDPPAFFSQSPLPVSPTPTPPQLPGRRLPSIPQHPSDSHPPSSYHGYFPVPPAHPPELSSFHSSASLPPPPQHHDYQRHNSWEDEEQERSVALALSIEEMRLSENEQREQSRAQREREEIKLAEEASLREHLQGRQNQASWETWEIGRGNGTYDGLGSSSYYHTVRPTSEGRRGRS